MLTGKEGQAPYITTIGMDDYRSITSFEFHGLNPYRATMDLRTDILNSTHDFTNTE
jgi:hypothetical protein